MLCSATDVASPVPYASRSIFARKTWVFTLFRRAAAGGRVCRGAAVHARSVLLQREASDYGKSPEIAACKILVRSPCYGFWRIIIGLLPLRASASSRIVSPQQLAHRSAQEQCGQRRDSASPFALMVEQTQPQQPAKPAQKDNRNVHQHAERRYQPGQHRHIRADGIGQALFEQPDRHQVRPGHQGRQE